MGIDYSASIGVIAMFSEKTPVYEKVEYQHCCTNDMCCNYNHKVNTQYCGSCGCYVSHMDRKIRSDQDIDEFLEEKGYNLFPEKYNGFDCFCLECLEGFDLKRDDNLFYEIPNDPSKIIAAAVSENKKILEDLEVYYGNKPKIVMAMYCNVG